MKTVLIPDRIQDVSLEQEILGQDIQIIAGTATTPNDIPDETWAKAEAILAWHDLPYDESLIRKLKQCQVIVRVGVGYDNVDLHAAQEQGIIVCNVPDYGTNDVADHAIGLMLGLSRGIAGYNDAAKHDDRWEWDSIRPLHRLTGATLGIIGLGRIGTATALRAKGFGLTVQCYDPYIPNGQEKAVGVTRCRTLEELLDGSDIVSLHVPLTDETHHLCNENFFHRMKPEAILINTARGNVVAWDALTTALKDNQIRGAGLDVLPMEPPDPHDRLIQAWKNNDAWLRGRLIITPHSAFYNLESYRELRVKAAEEVNRVLNGDAPLNPVVL